MWNTSWTRCRRRQRAPASTVGSRHDVRTPHRALDSCGEAPHHGVVPVGPERLHRAGSSSTKRNPRFEHVLRDHRCAVGDRRQRIAIGCRSVGNPGNGKVATLTAFGRFYRVTRVSSATAGVVQFVRHQRRCAGPARHWIYHHGHWQRCPMAATIRFPDHPVSVRMQPRTPVISRSANPHLRPVRPSGSTSCTLSTTSALEPHCE